MKIFYSIVYFFFFVSTICAQNLDCCTSVSEVQETLEGDWLLKKDSRNKIYRFHFEKEKGEGEVDVLEELNLPPKAEHTGVSNDFEITESKVNITSDDTGFYIELIYSFGTVKERIKELSKNRLVYGKGTAEHVFTRDSD